MRLENIYRKMNQTITLRKISPADTSNIVKWRNSPSVKRNLLSQADLKPEQHLAYLKNVVDAGKCSQYIIQLTTSGSIKDIGTVFIKNIDLTNNKGEFGIFIGEDEARGKGCSNEAIKAILKVAFEQLHLNRVYLSVICDNISAIRAYERSGFRIEGILKEDYIRGNIYMDIMLMGITKKMWLEGK